MRKLLFLGFVFVSIFIIYIRNYDKKIYYLALGDSLACGMTPYNNYDYGYTDYIKDYLDKKNVLEKYINGFSKLGYRTTDLYRDIVDNKTINIGKKNQALKNALIKADLITISIGTNDLLSKVNEYSMLNDSEKVIYDYIDEVIVDVENLFEILRQYCKEEIFFVGYYNPLLSRINEQKSDKIFEYIDSQYEKTSNKYGIYYISIYNEFKNSNEYFPNPLNVHPSKAGYEKISKLIISKLK